MPEYCPLSEDLFPISFTAIFGFLYIASITLTTFPGMPIRLSASSNLPWCISSKACSQSKGTVTSSKPVSSWISGTHLYMRIGWDVLLPFLKPNCAGSILSSIASDIIFCIMLAMSLYPVINNAVGL